MKERSRTRAPALSTLNRISVPHFVEFADALLKYEHVTVARGVPSPFYLCVGRNRIRAAVTLRLVVEVHRYFRLRDRHDIERNAVVRILAEIGMEIPRQCRNVLRRERIERIVRYIRIPPVTRREDLAATDDGWTRRSHRVRTAR